MGTARLTYFTDDGSYGSGLPEHMVVLDTSLWTDKDWERVVDCCDSDRMDIAITICREHGGDN